MNASLAPDPEFPRARAHPGERRGDLLPWSVALLLVIALLLAPAFWNGFPLIFADTGGYLSRPFERALDIGRSALYGAILTVGLGTDFWIVLVIQAALCAWLLVLLLRASGYAGRPWLVLALVGALAVGTSLPWYTAQLMPDVFVGCAILAFCLLSLALTHLSLPERLGLALLIAIAIACHMSILALALGLLAVLVVIGPLLSRWLRLAPRLRWPTAATGAGVALALASNLVIGGQFTFTPGGTSFLFGRLVQDGLIARVLDDVCPKEGVQLCAYRSEIPDSADGWLWGWGSPFYKLGGWKAIEPEERMLIIETLKRYPAEHVTTAVAATFEQLLRFRTGEGIHPRDTEHAVRTLEQLAAGSMPRFREARQQRDLFDFTAINQLHVPLAAAAALALPVILVLASLHLVSAFSGAFAGLILLALLINAAVCGIFSNPNDRYQSRVIWLAPLAVAIAALDAGARRRSRVTASA